MVDALRYILFPFQSVTPRRRYSLNGKRIYRRTSDLMRFKGFSMYQALYRKYRPRCFGDVAGQEHITETLRRQIINDRLSHAYLFVGTRGTGKTTCAKILSRAVNCMNPVEGEPCNKCMFCVGIEEGSILDVLELDAASNNSVDNVRELRDEAIYSPATVKKRVYIVDEVHMLSLSAFNALLKILEEPPEHILFILATTELHKVPATIQSRCQKFSFKRLSPVTLANRLLTICDGEGLTLTPEAAEKLAALADGSMRDGISLLDQCASDDVVDLQRVQDTLGLVGQQELSQLIEMVADRDVMSALDILDRLYNDGRDMASLLGEMASLIRDILVFRLSPDSGLLVNAGFDKTALSGLSGKFSPERLFFSLDVLKTIISGMSRSGSSRLAVELCLIKLCNERLSDDPSALLSRVAGLESGIPTLSGAVSGGVVDAKDVSEKAPSEEVSAVASSSEPVAVTENDENTEESLPCNESGADEPSPCPDYWGGILGELKGEPSLRVLLNDSSKVQAGLNDNSLVINVTDSFVANMISSEFSGLIKDAARKVLGRDVLVNVEVVDSIGSEENKQSKLDSLSAFDVFSID